ncbi:hypothetical protein Taro_015006 [Colocasia esculenta]|uniref:Uncharacterized protein n=1 Tax=Colocasia esculenta TaxID=4460 RepID=A0A843UL54_COLES|nr:hypothetical protein [Colocasia esculenta]
MGICVSSQITRSGTRPGAAAAEWGRTAKVVHMGDGSAREYMAGAAKAGHVEADNPGYHLCRSEALHVGQRPPRSAESEDLQPGQVYLLLPPASLAKPLTLHDLCNLAVRASAALRRQPVSAAAATAGGRRRATRLPGKG